MTKLKPILFILFFQCCLLAGAKSFEYDGVKYDVIDATTVAVAKTKKAGKIIIPSEVSDKKNSYRVVSVAPKAFEKKKDGFYIMLPYTVTSLGERAFNNSALEGIAMPGVVEIGNDAFAYCSRLKVLAIPPSVKSIGNDAFWATHLSRLAFCDSDEPLLLGENNGNRGILSSGVEVFYLGRPVKYNTFPLKGADVSKLKSFVYVPGNGMKWEGQNPSIIPVKTETGLMPGPSILADQWKELDEFYNRESSIIREQLLKEQQERKRKEKEERNQNTVAAIKKFMDAHSKEGYYKKTPTGYTLDLEYYSETQHDGDYTVAGAGMMKMPTRSMIVSLTPTTITITDTEELQINCASNPRTGAPARPEDPFRDFFDCPKTAINCNIPSLGDSKLQVPFTYSCSHSMYKTKAGPFAPWRAKHIQKTTYNLSTIATKNKTSVKKVWEALLNYSLDADFIPTCITQENGRALVDKCEFDGNLNQAGERTAWIYVLSKMMEKAK